jgi:hypothetical protein
MRQPASALLVLVLAGACSGCDNFALFVSAPLPDSGLPPSAPPPGSIVLGEFVNGTFVVPEVSFNLRAPRSGTLFIRISWDRRQGDINLAFLSSVFSISSRDSSIVGTGHVVQGQQYRITVVGDRGPIPFTMTTAIE